MKLTTKWLLALSTVLAISISGCSAVGNSNASQSNKTKSATSSAMSASTLKPRRPTAILPTYRLIWQSTRKTTQWLIRTSQFLKIVLSKR